MDSSSTALAILHEDHVLAHAVKYPDQARFGSADKRDVNGNVSLNLISGKFLHKSGLSCGNLSHCPTVSLEDADANYRAKWSGRQSFGIVLYWRVGALPASIPFEGNPRIEFVTYAVEDPLKPDDEGNTRGYDDPEHSLLLWRVSTEVPTKAIAQRTKAQLKAISAALEFVVATSPGAAEKK